MSENKDGANQDEKVHGDIEAKLCKIDRSSRQACSPGYRIIPQSLKGLAET